ncbi:MAG: WYL domain-containing protein [Acidimicrobiales bacterium]
MTAVIAPGRAWGTLEAALRERRPVRLSYHGRLRTVCPHALGWKNGKAMLLAYQTGGQTSTGSLPADPRRRWRNLFVDEIDHVDAADPSSTWDTADNYNPARPFNAIDHLSIAVVPSDPPARVR